MIEHITNLRVRYKETDQMGVAYYSNYLVWFEVARTELLRDAGHTYSEIEKSQGLWLMVVEANCKYKMPAKYDDILDIYCTVGGIGNTSMSFNYIVKRGSDILAEGMTSHVFTDKSARPKRVPSIIKEAFK